ANSARCGDSRATVTVISWTTIGQALVGKKIGLLHRRRLWFGGAISPRVRGSVVYLGLRVVHHGLPATHGGGVFVPHVELMPHRGKLLPHLGRHSRLDHDVAPTLGTDRETGVLQRF